jgi:hypothetical protein
MTAELFEGDTFVIDGREPMAKRLMLAGAGLFCIVVSTYELRHGLKGFGWWTLFFGFILLGAWSVGLPLLFASIAGEGLRWTFRSHVLILERTSLLRRRTQKLTASDVVRTEIRCIDWDSRADTFSVVVHLRSGEAIETPDYETESYAEEIRAEIERRLGLRRSTT